MPDVLDEPGWIGARSFPTSVGTLTNAVRAAGPPLPFGVRLWVSVCLALYVAVWLELDNAYWAGTTAGLMCQPHLGASLRRGWFRMIGTFVGALAIVVLTACFPQDRGRFFHRPGAVGRSLRAPEPIPVLRPLQAALRDDLAVSSLGDDPE